MRLRVLRHPLARWFDPAAVFAALYGDTTDSFWLDSGVHAVEGRSYLGHGARSRSSADASGSTLDFLRADLAGYDVASSDVASSAIEADAGGFALGWVGWLGYELRSETVQTPRTRTSRYPDAALLFADRAIEFDHATGVVTLLALGTEWNDSLVHWREQVVETMERAGEPVPGRPRVGATASWRYSDEEYLAMIRQCQSAIVEGDAYQLCLTTEATVEGAYDPLATYLALREASPSHHGALLRIGGVSLLSSSPEQFLSLSPDGIVESRPIKGTRRRGDTPQEDAVLRAELQSSEKERAENLMIVDLMRNDIARVSEVGSVEVPSLLAVESYAQVHQLVSTVRGRLAAGLDAVDAVTACFPAGSMTGAPKLSATLILDSLEQRARGIYSGAFGYFGLDGRVDLAMVIRSIVLDGDGATVGSGGGITALSDPLAELEEVRIKAAALLRVLGAGGGPVPGRG